MSRSFGPGSPIVFVCPVARQNRYPFNRWSLPDGHDQIVRTGRMRPRRGRGRVGARSMLESHEYRCECGHVGWTNHQDVLRYPVVTPVECPMECGAYVALDGMLVRNLDGTPHDCPVTT